MPIHTSFSSLGVPAELCQVLAARDIVEPTPIQAATLPDALAGRDVLGRGRTGSGKTFAFLLPVVARLAGSRRSKPGRPRALILAPTRELANQINESLKPLAKAAGLTSRTVFGGVNQRPQVNALARGVDVVIACPGRLEDLMQQGHVTLAAVEITVLDEADLMADLGFMPSVQRLLKATPRGGQRLLFSATLDDAVQGLVDKFLQNPVIHEADSAEVDEAGVLSHHVLQVNTENHLDVLMDLAAAPGRTIVFTRTKHRASRIAKQLNQAGIPATELQGNMSQNARSRSMDAFHSGAATALVATDIAARGIHVDDVKLVVHADPPMEHKAYLHRSGRTARAGCDGTVVTLMLNNQRRSVRDLTRKAGIHPTITKVADAGHEVLTEIAPGERAFPGAFVLEKPAAQTKSAAPKSKPGRRSKGRHSGSSNGSDGQRAGRHAGARAESRDESRERDGSRGGFRAGSRQGRRSETHSDSRPRRQSESRADSRGAESRADSRDGSRDARRSDTRTQRSGRGQGSYSDSRTDSRRGRSSGTKSGHPVGRRSGRPSNNTGPQAGRRKSSDSARPGGRRKQSVKAGRRPARSS